MNDAPALDAMLTREQAAAWLQLSERQLAENSNIPVFKLGHKTCRYHPRTIITALAAKAGLHPKDIAASFGIDLRETKV